MAVALENGRLTSGSLRRGFTLLALFGLMHGAHEWMEMFQILGLASAGTQQWQIVRVAVLAISFLGLVGFGATLLYVDRTSSRRWLALPAALLLLWGGGLVVLGQQGRFAMELWLVTDVWTRYTLAIPSALLAGIGLLTLRRSFRRREMRWPGRDSLVAAAAFMTYGIVGQLFTQPSSLPPSTRINTQLFLELFGFPVQLLRATAALVIAVSVIRMMRWFEVQRQHQLSDLQRTRLQEAERRRALRGELLNRVVQAQEAERERIARELHDETGQALTAIGLGLHGIATKLRAAAPEAAEQLSHLEQLTKLSLDELQRLIAGLRPSHLDDLGLAAALRWLADDVESHSPLAVRVEIEGDEPPLPAVISTGLFRVAQEALTNVVKHASAELATVRLDYRPDRVGLEVTDNGIGFDTPGADRPSWGLMGIQERVTLMGGDFELSSERGKGTRVRVSVPTIPESEQEHVHTAAAGR